MRLTVALLFNTPSNKGKASKLTPNLPAQSGDACRIEGCSLRYAMVICELLELIIGIDMKALSRRLWPLFALGLDLSLLAARYSVPREPTIRGLVIEIPGNIKCSLGAYTNL